MGASGDSMAAIMSMMGSERIAQAQIAMMDAIGEIVICVDDWPVGQNPPLVLLVPTKERSSPRVQEPERQPGIQSLIARFEDVEPGEYLAAFEPLERSTNEYHCQPLRGS